MKQAILDILLTANEYNLGEKTTKKWGEILKLVNYMSKNCPNIPSNINRALSDLGLRFGAKGGLSQKEMKWANKAVQSRQMDLFNTQMHMGPQQQFYPQYNPFGQPPVGPRCFNCNDPSHYSRNCPLNTARRNNRGPRFNKFPQRGGRGFQRGGRRGRG